MNKKVICVFSLILYLLVAATLLSTKVQEEMTTLVKVESRAFSRENGGIMSVSWRAIYTDSNGDHLYEVREGTGGQTGLRVSAVLGFDINPVYGIAQVKGIRGYNFVVAASRQPQDGKLAKIVEEFQKVDDTYLYYYPKGSPPEESWELNKYIEVIGQTSNTLLMAATGVESPFLPHTAKTWTVTTDLAQNVYSLEEAEAFFQQLPCVTIALGIFALGILFWLCGTVTSLLGGRKSFVWFNTIAAAASLIALWFALQGFDLPASVLPNSNILDFAYYKEEFSLIFDSLRELGMMEHSIFRVAEQAEAQCAQRLGLVALASGIILFAELIVAKIWSKQVKL